MSKSKFFIQMFIFFLLIRWLINKQRDKLLDIVQNYMKQKIDAIKEKQQQRSFRGRFNALQKEDRQVKTQRNLSDIIAKK